MKSLRTILLVLLLICFCIQGFSQTLGFKADTTYSCKHVPLIFTDTTHYHDTIEVNEWEWSFGDGDPIITYINTIEHSFEYAGMYSVRMKVRYDNKAPQLTKANYIAVRDTPVVNLAIDTSYSGGSFSRFFECDPYDSIYSYLWDFGDSEIATSGKILHTYSSSGTYFVKVIVNYGKHCTDTLTETVTIEDEYLFPNFFSPNGDDYNEVFFVKTNGYTVYKMTIMNRWGQIVFTSENKLIRWDGRNSSGMMLPPGQYAYFIESASGDSQYSKSGWVLLNRDK